MEVRVYGCPFEFVFLYLFFFAKLSHVSSVVRPEDSVKQTYFLLFNFSGHEQLWNPAKTTLLLPYSFSRSASHPSRPSPPITTQQASVHSQASVVQQLPRTTDASRGLGSTRREMLAAWKSLGQWGPLAGQECRLGWFSNERRQDQEV